MQRPHNGCSKIISLMLGAPVEEIRIADGGKLLRNIMQIVVTEAALCCLGKTVN